MSKLLAAGFSRLFKKKTFYICVIIMALDGALISISGYLDKRSGFQSFLDTDFFQYTALIPILMSVFCAMFIGTEYSDGTMRNKIITGHKRSVIYLSNFIICAAAGMMMCAAYFATSLGLGIPLLGFFAGDIGTITAWVGCSMAMLPAVTGIFTLISLTVRSKSASAVLSIILAFTLLFVAGMLYTLLQQPEYYHGYTSYEGVYIEGNGEMNDMDSMPEEIMIPAGEPELIPNPHYVSGVKRQIFQFIVDFTPTGQAIQLGNRDVSNPPLLVGYSLFIAIATTAAGLIKFNKMNLN